MGFRALAPYVWPIYGPWMSASLGMSLLLVALPIILVRDGHGYAVASIVAGAGGAGAATGALPVGWATDQWGPARVGAGSLVAMVGSAAIMTASGTIVLLGLGHFVFGAGEIGRAHV